MHVFGNHIPNRKLVNAFGKGILSALGSLLVYGIVVTVIYLWYRISCTRNGTCVSSVVRRLTSHNTAAAAAAGQDGAWV